MPVKAVFGYVLADGLPELHDLRPCQEVIFFAGLFHEKVKYQPERWEIQIPAAEVIWVVPLKHFPHFRDDKLIIHCTTLTAYHLLNLGDQILSFLFLL